MFVIFTNGHIRIVTNIISFPAVLHAISDDTVISYSAERELVFPPLSTRRFVSTIPSPTLSTPLHFVHPILHIFQKNPQNLVNFEKKQYLLSKRDFYMEGLRAIEELQQSHITRKGVDSFPGSLSTKQVQQPDLEGVAKLEVAQSQLSEVINIVRTDCSSCCLLTFPIHILFDLAD